MSAQLSAFSKSLPQTRITNAPVSYTHLKEFNISRNCVSGGLSRRGVNCRNEICKIFGRTVNVFVYADKFNVLKVVFYDFQSSPVLAYIGIFKVFLKLGILPKNIETVSESLYLISVSYTHLCLLR